jgi:Predicted xylanase/chitin deacetylase
MDEVCRRAVTLPKANRFACLTFDGGCKDVITQAYPVLSKHGVPFTVYLPTAFPDGLGEAWWLALEDMIAREDRVNLVIDRKERRFATGSTPEKYETFEFLRAGCGRCRRRIFRSRSTTSARATPSISRRCRATRRWTGTIWRSSPPIRWDDRQRHGELSRAVQPERSPTRNVK